MQIDREKMLVWLKERKREIGDDLNYARKEGLTEWKNALSEKIKMLKEVEKKIESGTFDIESEGME